MAHLKLNFLCLLCLLSVAEAQDYSISINQIGIGNEWRSGEITPIQVNISTQSPIAQTTWVEWEVPNADGDLVLWGRPVTLTPGVKTTTWLYAPTKAWASNESVWTIRMRAWENQSPTKELAKIRFAPRNINSSEIQENEGLIAIFGNSRLGLEGYLPIEPFDTKPEAIRIISGLTSEHLPDQWIGLQSLDAVVWANAPPILTSSQINALTEWVYRGGHLVITLPVAGDPWSLNNKKPVLPQLLDGINPQRATIPINKLNGILGRNQNWLPLELQVNTFGHKQTMISESETPLMSLPDGRVVVVQHQYGFGAITCIGINLASGRLTSLGLPETALFWNRILGKRNDTPTTQIINMLDASERLSRSLPYITRLSLPQMSAKIIAMSTTAAGRLSIVFILILSYWLICCPLGYYLLKKIDRQRWSWMLFCATAILFSICTLLFARNLTPVESQSRHLSIIDHVYGVEGQHVQGWCSIFLPEFGSAKIQLEKDALGVLLPWTPPEDSMAPPFIDQQEITINVSQTPIAFKQPSRATTANFHFDWLGGIDSPFYAGMIRVVPEKPISRIQNRANRQNTLTGQIINQLNTELSDVTVIWITDQQVNPPQQYIENGTIKPWNIANECGKPLNQGFTWRLGSWNSNEVLNLASLDISSDAKFEFAVAERYKPNNENNFWMNAGNLYNDQQIIQKHLEMMSIYSHLEPPVYQREQGDKKNPPRNQTTRIGSRKLDFAQWFGRPCIIVMGFINDAPIPAPITIDGEYISESSGVTLVRWFYPLP